MFVFRKIWRALFSWKARFEIRSFVLLPTNFGNEKKFSYCKQWKWKHHLSEENVFFLFGKHF